MKKKAKYSSKICYMLLTAVAVIAPSKPLLADDTDVFFTFNEENYTRAKPNVMFIMDENSSMKAPGMFTYDEPLCGQVKDEKGNLITTKACYNSQTKYNGCYETNKWYFIPNGNTKLAQDSKSGCAKPGDIARNYGKEAHLRTDRPLDPQIGKYCSTLTEDIAKTGFSKQDQFLGLYERRCKKDSSGWVWENYDSSNLKYRQYCLGGKTEEYGWWALDAIERADPASLYANKFVPHLSNGLSNTNKIHAIACMSDQNTTFKNKDKKYINTDIPKQYQDNPSQLLKHAWVDNEEQLSKGNKKFVEADWGIIYSGNYLNYLATKTETKTAARHVVFQAALKRYIERSNHVRLGLASFKPKTWNNTTCLNGGAGNKPANADSGYTGSAYCNGGGDGGSIDVPVIDIDEVHEKWRWLPDMIIPPEYPGAKTTPIAFGKLFYQNYSEMNADMPHRQWLWLQVDQYFGMGYSSGGGAEYPLRSRLEYKSERHIPGLGVVNNFPLTMATGSQALATEYRPLGETLFEVGRYFKGEKPYFGVYSRPETWSPLSTWGGKHNSAMRPQIWSIEDYRRDVIDAVVLGPWGPVYDYAHWKDHWWGDTDIVDLSLAKYPRYQSPIAGATSKSGEKNQDPCEANVAVIFTDYTGDAKGNQWSDITNVNFEGSPREDNQAAFDGKNGSPNLPQSGVLPPFDDNDEGDLMESLWPAKACLKPEEEAVCGIGALNKDACTPTKALKCKGFINEYGTCLPGVAQYLAENDLSAIPGKQNLRTFVVHYWNSNKFKGKEPIGTAMLKKTAELGKGKYIRFGDSLSELDAAIAEIMNLTALNPIGAGTFVAPAASVDFSNRLQHSENVYFSLFEPSETNRWKGNVKRYKMAYIKDKDQPAVVSATCDVNGKEVDCKSALDACNVFEDDATSGWGDPVAAPTKPDGADVSVAGVAGELTEKRNIVTDYCWDGNKDLPLPKANDACFNINHADSKTVRSFAIDKLGMRMDSTMESDLELMKLYVKRKIAYIQGFKGETDNAATSVEEVRKSIGDPLHSQPKIMNYAKGTLLNNSVPKPVIYFGTNEGYLHAVDADTGKELFGFMPEATFKVASKYHDNEVGSTRNKLYGIDGEIETWINDTNGNGLVDSGEKAYIFFGMRRGGNSYFALDVTDPTSPKMAWHITNTARNNHRNGNSFYELGQTWAKPTLIKAKPKLIKVINDYGATDTKLSDSEKCDTQGKNCKVQARERAIIVLTAGYDPLQDSRSLSTSDNLGRAIYLVDAESGKRLWAAGRVGDLNSAYNATNENMKYSFAASPAVYDVDGDGFIDTIIAADTGGQIWRINLEPKVEKIENGKFAGYETVEPTLELVAQFADDSQTVDRPYVNRRKFFNTADIMFDRTDRSLIVAIGTGRRPDPLSKDVADRLYVLRLKVNAVYEEQPAVDSAGKIKKGHLKTLTEKDLFDATSKTAFKTAGENSNSTSPNKDRANFFANGFMLRLGETYLKNADEEQCNSKNSSVPKAHCKNLGEKLISNASIFNNTVIFTSYLPSEIPEFCGAALGDNRFNAISLQNPDARVTVPLSQHGIAPKPAVLLLPAKNGERKPAIVVGTEVVKRKDLGGMESLKSIYTLSRDKLIKMWLER